MPLVSPGAVSRAPVSSREEGPTWATVLAHISVAKYHTLSGVSNRLTVLEAVSVRSACWPGWVLVWVFFQLPALSLCALMLFPLSVHRERERPLSLPLLLRKALIPSWGSHPHGSSQPNYLPKIPFPTTITLGGSSSAYVFWEDIDIQPVTVTFCCQLEGPIGAGSVPASLVGWEVPRSPW